MKGGSFSASSDRVVADAGNIITIKEHEDEEFSDDDLDDSRDINGNPGSESE